jgi:hypothetical protein
LEITMAKQSNVTAAERRPNPNEKLVKVFDSEQESEAMVVKGLLDSAGIENDLKSGQPFARRVSRAGGNDHFGAGRGCGEGARPDHRIPAVACGSRVGGRSG